MNRRRSIRGRMIIWVLAVSSSILGLVIAWNYGAARQRLTSDMQSKAVFIADGAARRVDAQLGVLQGVVNGMALSLSSSDLQMPFASVRAMQTQCLLDNPGIYGICVALEPAVAPPEWPDLAAWEYRSARGLEYLDLAGPDHAHTREDWYTLPKYLERAVWSEPYQWDGVIMVTYSVPLYIRSDGERRFAGVVTCDLTLDWLSQMLAELPLGAGGYGLLMSRSGTYVAHPQTDLVLNESVFSIAEERNDPDLRALGQRMVSGEPGIYPFVSFVTGELSWLAYTPLQSADWIMAALISRDEMNAAILRLSRLQGLVGAGGLLILCLAVGFIAGSITRPIRKLHAAADTLANGHLDVELPQPQGRDEVAGLTRAFRGMRDHLKRYMADLEETTKARERMHSELRIAHDIQMGLVPKTFPPFPARKDLDLYAILDPAREVGGDFYDFFLLDDDRMFFAIGDVSGKGVPAALFMAVTRSFLRSAFRSETHPAQALMHINDELAEGNESCMFVTLFCAVYRFSDGRLDYVNAGHPSPVIRHADGRLEWVTAPRGPVAGAMPGIDYTAGSLTLPHDAMLVTYTDGVTEAMNPATDWYGENRLAARLADTCGVPDCRSLINALVADVRAFTQGAEPSDDITLLVLKRVKTPAASTDPPAADAGLRLSIANSQAELQKAIEALDAYMDARDVPSDTRYGTRLALEELVSNTIKYGYDDDADHWIQVAFQPGSPAIMTITDDGHAFNPLSDAAKPDLDQRLEDRPIGGLGLHIIQAMGMELTYRRDTDRNVLRIMIPATRRYSEKQKGT